MKKSASVWLIVAVCLIVGGSILFAVSIASMGFEWTRLGTVQYETNTYTVDGQFDRICIRETTGKIIFLPSEDDTCRVECLEDTKTRHEVYVSNGTLTIEVINHRKWYEYIGIAFRSTETTVYLPQKAYQSLEAESNTGDIEVPGWLTFRDVSISGDTSDIICRAAVTGVLDIETDTGKIYVETANGKMNGMELSSDTGRVEVRGISVDGDVEIKTKTGRIELHGVRCGKLSADSNTGRVMLEQVIAEQEISVETNTGDVVFDRSDAASIDVKSDTGDVTGSLLSGKIFDVESHTGHARVPAGTQGGRCHIETETGDIEIEIVG